MPTVLRIGSHRFFFYAGDKEEPRHIHVERDDKVAKFWLEPIMLHSSSGFSRIEISRIQKMIEENHARLVEAWNDYFGG